MTFYVYNNIIIEYRERTGLRVLSYHLWFSSMAVSWIDTALKKGRERIELAIEKDKVCTYKNASNLGDNIILSK